MLAHGPGGGDAKLRVLQATDIVELIGRSVALKRAGKEFVGLCPFHQEKTPSFYVSPSKQFFLCRGCKKGGSAIDFVMSRDRVGFLDALCTLADAAGIQLPQNAGEKQNPGQRQILLDAHAAACSLFEKSLWHPQHGQAARQYLAQRGFTEETIRRFRIGLAPDAWDELLKSPAMRTFGPMRLAEAGLVKARESGEGYYDTFRNRLIFPIRDESGRTIAFGGRVLPGNDQETAKYLNSPETPLFSKSRCIFGLDAARTRIVESRTVAVVEGYTDVVMAHQHGATNVVSVLGTALTAQHVSILRRFADRIVLLFDADTAGQAAVDRALELFLTQPVEIAIASLPDGVDPDELLLQRGVEEFNKLLDQATDALTFKWKQLARQMKANNSLTAQQNAVQQYLQSLAAARDAGPVDQLRWGSALARVSRLTDIPVSQLNRRFSARASRSRSAPRPPADAKADQAQEPKENAPAAQSETPPACKKAESFILGLLLLEPQRWSKLQQTIAPSDFTDDALRPIAEAFWRLQKDDGPPQLNEFLTALDEQFKSLAAQCAAEVQGLEELDVALAANLAHLAGRRRRQEEKNLVAQLRRRGIESGGSGETNSDFASDVEVLRQLQERARQPDLKRAVT